MVGHLIAPFVKVKFDTTVIRRENPLVELTWPNDYFAEPLTAPPDRASSRPISPTAISARGQSHGP
jgi:hypothetical protein